LADAPLRDPDPVTKPQAHDPEVDEYVRLQSGPLGEVVAMLVATLRRDLPDPTEHIHHGSPWFYSRGRSVGYVATYKDHVNLGLRFGAELDDPDRLLEGTGKSIRHVKLRSIEDVPRTRLEALVHRAAARRP